VGLLLEGNESPFSRVFECYQPVVCEVLKQVPEPASAVCSLRSVIDSHLGTEFVKRQPLAVTQGANDTPSELTAAPLERR
jgi:hypothetical protein